MNKEYGSVTVMWPSKYGSETQVKIFDASKNDALQAAHQFGYRSPKWYQFWKPRATFITTQE